MWATRLMHESRSHEDTSLTYRDSEMPLSLSEKDFQHFMKRLRKRLSTIGTRIKFFHCGEYSPKKTRPVGPFDPRFYQSEGQRPHYHAIIFGYDFPDKTLRSVRDDISIYTSDFLADVWGKGYCTVGDLTFESAAYVARYSLKKINGPLEQKPDPITGLCPYERTCPVTGEITEVAKERVSMSNGIGADFYDKYSSDMFPRDYVVINGHQAKTPRYYDNKYDIEEPEIMDTIKERRIVEMRRHAKDNTPDMLRQREAVKQAQLSMLKREGIE